MGELLASDSASGRRGRKCLWLGLFFLPLASSTGLSHRRPCHPCPTNTFPSVGSPPLSCACLLPSEPLTLPSAPPAGARRTSLLALCWDLPDSRRMALLLLLFLPKDFLQVIN